MGKLQLYSRTCTLKETSRAGVYVRSIGIPSAYTPEKISFAGVHAKDIDFFFVDAL